MGYSETKCEIFNADDKTKLNVYEWIPKDNIRAVFLAVHGGMAHGGDFVTPALYFLEKGVATYAPDLRWHGTYPKYNTGGKVFFHVDSVDETINDIHNLYLWIRKKHPSLPIFILCHSYGALVSLNYGLTAAKDDDISGFIVSSPWLKNIVQVPKALEIVAKVIARINPKFAITPKPLTDSLTHDPVITARHHEDERIGIRGTQGSASLIIELPKAQDFVIENMKNWTKFPIFAVLAGQDKLADPATSEMALTQVPQKLLTLKKYENNFHENFNEVNRNEIFNLVWNWMGDYMKKP